MAMAFEPWGMGMMIGKGSRWHHRWHRHASEPLETKPPQLGNGHEEVHNQKLGLPTRAALLGGLAARTKKEGVQVSVGDREQGMWIT